MCYMESKLEIAFYQKAALYLSAHKSFAKEQDLLSTPGEVRMSLSMTFTCRHYKMDTLTLIARSKQRFSKYVKTQKASLKI